MTRGEAPVLGRGCGTTDVSAAACCSLLRASLLSFFSSRSASRCFCNKWQGNRRQPTLTVTDSETQLHLDCAGSHTAKMLPHRLIVINEWCVQIHQHDHHNVRNLGIKNQWLPLLLLPLSASKFTMPGAQIMMNATLKLPIDQ